MNWEIYRDASQKFRWRLVRNGKVIGDSGEGYSKKHHCVRMVNQIRQGGGTLIDMTHMKESAQ
jgi:uncharacterized protein YegP (UPF0339 family)